MRGRNVAGSVACILLLGCAAGPAASSKRNDATGSDTKYGVDVDRASRDEIARLDDSVGYDDTLNVTTKPATREALVTIVAAADRAAFAVRQHALSLMEHLVSRREVSTAADLDLLADAAARVLTSPTNQATDGVACDLARRVLWQVKGQRITDPSERARFLAEYVEGNAADSVYYSYEALRQLPELGSTGKQILIGIHDDGAKRHISPEVMKRVRTGLARIGIVEGLGRVGTAGDKVALLTSSAERAARDHSQSGQDFSEWLVQELARIGPAAGAALRAIADDPAQSDRVRRAAVFAISRVSPSENP